ncbi:hypothetical protein WDU94_014993 [Cyamophila willieti]
MKNIDDRPSTTAEEIHSVLQSYTETSALGLTDEEYELLRGHAKKSEIQSHLEDAEQLNSILHSSVDSNIHHIHTASVKDGHSHNSVLYRHEKKTANGFNDEANEVIRSQTVKIADHGHTTNEENLHPVLQSHTANLPHGETGEGRKVNPSHFRNSALGLAHEEIKPLSDTEDIENAILGNDLVDEKDLSAILQHSASTVHTSHTPVPCTDIPHSDMDSLLRHTKEEIKPLSDTEDIENAILGNDLVDEKDLSAILQHSASTVHSASFRKSVFGLTDEEYEILSGHTKKPEIQSHLEDGEQLNSKLHSSGDSKIPHSDRDSLLRHTKNPILSSHLEDADHFKSGLSEQAVKIIDGHTTVKLEPHSVPGSFIKTSKLGHTDEEKEMFHDYTKNSILENHLKDVDHLNEILRSQNEVGQDETLFEEVLHDNAKNSIIQSHLEDQEHLNDIFRSQTEANYHLKSPESSRYI